MLLCRKTLPSRPDLHCCGVHSERVGPLPLQSTNADKKVDLMLFKDSYSELQVVLDPQLLYNAICTQRAGSAFNCRLAAELTAGWMSPAFMKSMSSGVQLRPVEKIKHLSLPCRLSTHLLCITLPTCCTHKYTHRLKAGLFRKSDLTYFDVTIVRAMLSSTAL